MQFPCSYDLLSPIIVYFILFSSSSLIHLLSPFLFFLLSPISFLNTQISYSLHIPLPMFIFPFFTYNSFSSPTLSHSHPFFLPPTLVKIFSYFFHIFPISPPWPLSSPPPSPLLPAGSESNSKLKGRSSFMTARLLTRGDCKGFVWSSEILYGCYACPHCRAIFLSILHVRRVFVREEMFAWIRGPVFEGSFCLCISCI